MRSHADDSFALNALVCKVPFQGAVVALVHVVLTLSVVGQTAPVTLAPTTAPTYGQPGTIVVSLTGSGFPTGAISPKNVIVHLEPLTAGDGPSSNFEPRSITAILNTTRRVSFVVPQSFVFPLPKEYLVSISGKTDASQPFASANKAKITINPPARLLSVTPPSGPPGASLKIDLVGQYTNFVQGSTTSDFGPGITISSLTVKSPTMASVQVVIDRSASRGQRAVSITTGAQQATLLDGFVVTSANQPPVITSTPSKSWNWTQLSPTGLSADGRSAAGSSPQAYDDANDRMIFFSGDRSGGAISPPADVWVLANASGVGANPNWIQLNPAGPGPAGRSTHSLAYVKASNRLIVLNGRSRSDVYSDVWALTNANGLGGTPSWLRLPDIPNQRSYASVVHDPNSNRLIVFGGINVSSCATNFNDVWVLKDADGSGSPAWIQLSPRGSLPPALESHSAIYDAASNRMVILSAGQFVAYGRRDHNLRVQIWGEGRFPQSGRDN